ncbi:uncharacterized protein PHACADRAFT_255325 [Phanerochaete carnosa HHB-10118-sp]|uniref:Uncharacterized protein n=1 Tax=Phanerochaete carnosa (strain HHB-10118-sp) TaxID=650164 RepID=K5W7S1_PHACS|nr:uncharacterized protein PHACADRAFT_255325 [Phanerochaete carnosa HHB-10118-sp]EKM55019.1 hypothetical protein PHACADRAFT_255325 [Phanerochaete carnosa HHB-10118-sp]
MALPSNRTSQPEVLRGRSMRRDVNRKRHAIARGIFATYVSPLLLLPLHLTEQYTVNAPNRDLNVLLSRKLPSSSRYFVTSLYQSTAKWSTRLVSIDQLNDARNTTSFIFMAPDRPHHPRNTCKYSQLTPIGKLRSLGEYSGELDRRGAIQRVVGGHEAAVLKQEAKGDFTHCEG